MLSKIQLLDACKCDDSIIAQSCRDCSLCKETNCFTEIAKTAIELMEENEKLKNNFTSK